jgi:bifunctional non-homologous end joining protein LigD
MRRKRLKLHRAVDFEMGSIKTSHRTRKTSRAPARANRFNKDGDEILVPIVRGKTRTAPLHPERGGAVRKIHVSGEGMPVQRLLAQKTLKGDARVEVDRTVVALTSLDRVYFPDTGYTKADLLRYYAAVADTLLPYLADRPLILKRFPLGINGKFFFQHDVDEAPDFVRTYTTQALGHRVDYVVCNNTATLLYLANMGVIPLHPWHSRTRAIDRPDYVVFDLDPGKVEFATIRRLALAVKSFLDRLGLDSYPKTSGSRGMHVYVPLRNTYTYTEIAAFAERVARRIVAENPDIATTVRSLAARKPNQVYVDHLQNAQGKTIVAAYSVRERASATVSAPLTWQQVRGSVTPGDFTIKNMPGRLKQKGDLFAPVLTNKQSLKDALKILDALEKPPHKHTYAEFQVD